MSAHRRQRSRARRHLMPLEFETEPFSVWLPDPDDPVAIESFGDAATLAFELLEFSAERELLILLDEQRIITAIVVDPPPPVGVFIGRCDVPGLEVPFCQTMSLVMTDHIHDGPPSDDDRAGYLALRRFHVWSFSRMLCRRMKLGLGWSMSSSNPPPGTVWLMSATLPQAMFSTKGLLMASL